ncbi:unnamed protein product [Closterium sp. NIES-64]|nr:unnamed protein product [Closterium sp. NIES-64]CAI5960731.1 unnamed protein product [Closterium sp. NIES-65]CAI5971853.1 unnamed protein product [Closterium sp. NIES-64]
MFTPSFFLSPLSLVHNPLKSTNGAKGKVATTQAAGSTYDIYDGSWVSDRAHRPAYDMSSCPFLKHTFPSPSPALPLYLALPPSPSRNSLAAADSKVTASSTSNVRLGAHLPFTVRRTSS